MSLEIRPLRPEDEVVWRDLWTAYLSFYEATVAEEVYQTTFARLLDPDPQEFHGRIALSNGVPVGLVHFLFHRHCWRVENVIYLQDLFVAPHGRRQGIGRALIDAVYEAADDHGCPGVYWMTQDFNKTARTLYDQVAEVTPFIKYQRRLV